MIFDKEYCPSSEKLDNPKYPNTLLDKLYDEYIFLNDVPNYDVGLSNKVLPSCFPHEVEDMYKLAWQLLIYKCDLKVFKRLVLKIALTGKITEEEKGIFKDIRACMKHMCFIYANLDRRHRYPLLLQIIRVLAGDMQDAFKSNERGRTLFYGLLLRFTLSSFFYRAAMKQLMSFKLDTPEGILSYQKIENKELEDRVQQVDHHTGHEFHQIRKIISRRVAFNDTLRTLRPDPDLDQLSQYLATINGLMGRKHDDFIENKLKGKINYKKDRFKTSLDIIKRIKDFIDQVSKE